MTQSTIKLFVTGIGTDVGKTVVSAGLVHLLGAAYWKPIQSGSTESSDTKTIAGMTTRGAHYFPEQYLLRAPLSPHAAAHLEQITINTSTITLPSTDHPLVVEGAGGLMVPLNDSTLVIDLIAQLGIPALLVSRHYLGSINHTLLSLQALEMREIPVAGMVFVGDELPASEIAILSRYPGIKSVRVPWFEQVGPEEIEKVARLLTPFSSSK